MDIVNETIGNFLDLIAECPVTQTTYGIKGLLEESRKPEEMSYGNEEPPKVYKVTSGGSNLVPGPNIISFTGREQFGCEPFHHAVLHIIPTVTACYIIDSWTDRSTRACRPVTSRCHNLQEVIGIIDELNSDTITPERTYQILYTYFEAYETLRNTIAVYGLVLVHTINPHYITDIYMKCERVIVSGVQRHSNFGGKMRKRYTNRRTIRRNKNRQNKKYRSKKYKSNRNYIKKF
jgi:hypothetical protein